MAKDSSVGRWAFIIGLAISLVIGVAQQFIGTGLENPGVISVLIMLGIIVGIMNITHAEKSDFLLVMLSIVVTLVLAGSGFGSIIGIGPYLVKTIAALMAMLIPAVIIVSLKTIWRLAKDA